MGPRPDDHREGGFTDRLVSAHPWKHRRALFLALAGTALVLLAWIAAGFFLPGAGRCLRTGGFVRIRPGMMQAQVEDLLGGPPGDYGDNAGGVCAVSLEWSLAPPGSVEKVWFDDSHQFEVYFDRGGLVVGLHRKACFSRGQPTLMDRLRYLFGPLLPPR